MFDSPSDALKDFERRFTIAFHSCFRELVETKHLYQRVSLEPSTIAADIRSRLIGDLAKDNRFDLWVNQSLSEFVVDVSEQPTGKTERKIRLQPTNVKLYCPNCKEREAFAPIWVGDPNNKNWGEFIQLIRSMRLAKASTAAPPQLPLTTTQYLLVLYQCQACQSEPHAFLVRINRRTWILTLDGRSPIETVEVPAYIPKEEQRFYSDALIANQTGKILAGLFYLRTFIEQFARRQTGMWSRNTGDEIMEAYTKTLPPGLSDQMPSLGDWYDQLSSAVHEAREDAELFEKAIKEINHHFDIRRVHRIPEKPKEKGQQA